MMSVNDLGELEQHRIETGLKGEALLKSFANRPVVTKPLYTANPGAIRRFFTSIYEEISARVHRGHDPLPPFEQWLGDAKEFLD